jgi:hypothetical protein
VSWRATPPNRQTVRSSKASLRRQPPSLVEWEPLAGSALREEGVPANGVSVVGTSSEQSAANPSADQWPVDEEDGEVTYGIGERTGSAVSDPPRSDRCPSDRLPAAVFTRIGHDDLFGERRRFGVWR